MNDITQTLLRSVREAGHAILKLQQNGFAITRKANNDLLTQADLLANDILKTQLTHAYPEYGWLSEESVDELSRIERSRVWVVDPIDGTKEYAHGIPEYAISVALVENGQPILACVFNPAADELFYAVKDQGAWMDEKRLSCDNTESKRLLLLASRSEFERGEWAPFQSNHDVKVIGSIAYKLALVAAGRAHATFSLGPKSEWDIAAGVLLVSEAGGIVTNRQKLPFTFNQKHIRVDGIVAAAPHVSNRIFDIITDTQ